MIHLKKYIGNTVIVMYKYHYLCDIFNLYTTFIRTLFSDAPSFTYFTQFYTHTLKL